MSTFRQRMTSNRPSPRDEDACELLAATFQELGTEPMAVSSVAAAMVAISAFKPTVVVSDIGMPVDDGYALVTRLRMLLEEQGDRIPAVAVTAFAAPRDGERAIAAGFSAYLAKPVDAAQLISVFQTARRPKTSCKTTIAAAARSSR